MIEQKCADKEWIEAIAKTNRVDKILVEKVIRALMLLEGLTESGLDFVFKGGTALMLLFDSSRRVSIDIDIVVPDNEKDISTIVSVVCDRKRFYGFERQERMARTRINKEHYKLKFLSALNNQESYILLDVVKEDIHYRNTIKLPIDSTFVKQEDEPFMVRLPDFNNMLGDKITAFAPNTTGIPYVKGDKEMGMEIIKQMYDIGCLFDHADDAETVSEVFSSFAGAELLFRGSKSNIEDVLNDIIETSVSICLRQNTGKADFNILSKGIVQVKPFIFSESFHLEKAMGYAAKAAYIASVIKCGVKHFVHFDEDVDMTNWKIAAPMNSKLNKIKRSNPEAFFYLYQVSRMR